MTRSFTLLALTAKEELSGFENYLPTSNPLIILREQAALLLYGFIDNDAEILHPLFSQLIARPSGSFDEREAGDLLPDIIRKVAVNFSKGALTFEDRDRLEKLEKVAENVESRRGKPYTGGGARERMIRPRLEPFCDLGLLTKPERHRFNYAITPEFKRLISNWPGADSTDAFLEDRFFATLAGIHGFAAEDASDEEARLALALAGEQLKSTLAYSPIIDCALLAGIRLLFGSQRVLEVGRSREILKTWQKEAPDIVRFTVDRMGAMAYVKFLKPVPQSMPAKV